MEEEYEEEYRWCREAAQPIAVARIPVGKCVLLTTATHPLHLMGLTPERHPLIGRHVLRQAAPFANRAGTLESVDGRRRVRVRCELPSGLLAPPTPPHVIGPLQAIADADAADPGGSEALAAALDARYARAWPLASLDGAREARRKAAARLIARRAKAAAASPFTELGRRVIVRRGGFDPQAAM